MSEDERECLKQFYTSLRNNFLREKRLKENSVLISFLETRSTSRLKLLSESTLTSHVISDNALVSLLSKKYIQMLGEIGKYSITARGVWEYEKALNVIDEEGLLSYINDKFFVESNDNSSHEKLNLNDREKIILLTMISARAFSEKSAVTLNKNSRINDKWLELLGKTYDFLVDLGEIKKLRKEEFLEKKGNEHAASSVFRHNNDMPQKTRMIYKYTGNYAYFLNLDVNSGFSIENLSYLFWKLFRGELSKDTVDKIIEYCNSVSNAESIYLFDGDHAFSLPTYDSKLRDSLLDSIVSKSKWSKIH